MADTEIGGVRKVEGGTGDAPERLAPLHAESRASTGPQRLAGWRVTYVVGISYDDLRIACPGREQFECSCHIDVASPRMLVSSGDVAIV